MSLTHQTRCLQFDRTVAAGENSLIEFPGEFFRIKESSGAIQLSLDEEPIFDFDVGMAYRCPAGRPFRVIRIHNPGTSVLAVTILVGQGQIEDDRLNVINGRFSLPVIEAPAEATGGGLVDLAPGAEIFLSGSPVAPRVRRKGVLMVNFDLANPLIILNAAGVPFSACIAGTAWNQNISSPVTIKNLTSAANISCLVGETWYLP